MTSTVVVGGFFGDEGKGKIISYLAIKDNPKIIVRGGVGPNAGEILFRVFKLKYLHMILYPTIILLDRWLNKILLEIL